MEKSCVKQYLDEMSKCFEKIQLAFCETVLL